MPIGELSGASPPGFGPGGKFGGALLVGNFGDSHVSAFDLTTHKFLGQLSDAQGHPLVLNGGFQETNTKGLWGIGFGNGQGGTDPNALYFAAGINLENDGLFGKVTMTGEDDGGDHGGGDSAVRPSGLAVMTMTGTGTGGATANPVGGMAAAQTAGMSAVQALFQKVMMDVGQLAAEIAAFNASMHAPGTTLLSDPAFDQGLMQLFRDEMALMAAVRQEMNGTSAGSMMMP
jgi:hypothetical protein